ncbi:glycosyltransferase family 4 protein [Antarcticibacterium flavum]|uniref:Glycosyltransferase family 4 protein n=1 Tax=Antarcticibacterium flavum TaxID=2058175 RepID=A0A5B7X0I5_9FLAO|nr:MULTISPECIES: glycosyltransferase [Antarcticibacterium]MCM4158938.1 glycosyltransferase [Antarcticibacterium sp. W02-3]QCY68192.1 glycosyltransferase family 4 protein [Antarcticibacterium flavum]
MTKALVIGYVWPEPGSSAAGTRMMQLLEYFQHQDYSITFATTATPTPYSEDLESYGIRVKKIELNSHSFNKFVEELAPSIVVYDRYMMEEQFGWRVSQSCPYALTILDTEDLHFLRKFREERLKDPLIPLSALRNSDLARREIASIYRCDLSLIISEAEVDLLSNEFGVPKNLLLYLPFMQKQFASEEIQQLLDFEERKNFISIGNFKHAPNVDAVYYLKNKIWPLIHKELPEAQMHIYGAYPSPGILKLNDPGQNFLVKGRVRDAAEVVKKARVSLAPLRFGAGLKGKLTEAMTCGTPVVTTEAGAEGMGSSYLERIHTASTPEAFAAKAITLYTAKEKWNEAVRNGFTLVNNLFNKEQHHETLTARIKTIMGNLEKHRNDNFTGSMLKHHYSKSTYFLSKYIELKNELEKLQKLKNHL